MNELVKVGTKELPVIEWNGQRVITTAQLADIYETETENVKKNFQGNKNHFKEGEHFFLLKGNQLREFKDKVTHFHLVGKNANQLYLWTRRGASRHCKILGTDKAWEQFDVLEENYYNPQGQFDMSKLSPELQMFYAIADGQARMELEQKQQAERLKHVEQRVESIREVVALDTTSWRDDTGNILKKISMELGGGQAYSQVRAESYELLSKRMGVNLKQRLTNKRGRMADEGICKSTRDKLSYVDIIAEDKKLIEGYTAIVKEMAIRYGVGKE
jgi:hypothetical protein